MIEVKSPQKIMIARYRFIGDTILSIPFLRALREVYPDAEIHYYVGQDAYELMQHCPYVNKVICFEPHTLGFWKSISLIKKETYDTVYLLKRSFSSALITVLAGIPNRIGFNTEHRGFLLSKRIPYREFTHHEAQCFLDLLEFPPKETMWDQIDLTSWIPDEANTRIQETQRPNIVLHVTSTNPAKCWPIEHFTALAQQLLEEYPGTIYALGTKSETEIYDAIRQALPETIQHRLINLCGQTSLLESLALLQNMDLVVANDSGMIHMASAVKTPVIALFGPSDPNQWFPLSEKALVLTHPNLACRPCRMKISCQNRFPCLTEISPEFVFEQCKNFLMPYNNEMPYAT